MSDRQNQQKNKKNISVVFCSKKMAKYSDPLQKSIEIQFFRPLLK